MFNKKNKHPSIPLRCFLTLVEMAPCGFTIHPHSCCVLIRLQPLIYMPAHGHHKALWYCITNVILWKTIRRIYILQLDKNNKYNKCFRRSPLVGGLSSSHGWPCIPRKHSLLYFNISIKMIKLRSKMKKRRRLLSSC